MLLAIINHHDKEPPAWVDSASAYFENKYGEQWIAYPATKCLRVSGGDIDWAEIIVDNPNYKELASELFVALTKGGGFRGHILNEEELLWLMAVCTAAAAP